jgi:hypothetical protein
VRKGRAGPKDAGSGESESDEQLGRCFHAQFHSLGQQVNRRVPPKG